MINKAVILAGGMGTRMQEPSDTATDLDDHTAELASKGLKGLIPINGRPFLDYVLGSIFRAGVEQICLVVPPDSRDLQDYITDAAARSGKTVTWAVQEEPLGTAHALMCARDFVAGESFIMSNCDNIYPDGALEDLVQDTSHASCVMAFHRDALLEGSNFGEERVRRFAVVVADEQGHLRQIVEKPENPRQYERDGHLWMSMNLYRFTPAIFASCDRIEPDPERGELELTTAVLQLAQKHPVQVKRCSGGVVDMTGRDDIPPVRALLEGVSPGF